MCISSLPIRFEEKDNLRLASDNEKNTTQKSIPWIFED
jgi:hypothetical protein